MNLHRSHEDFSERKSTVRIDFHRRYYHTRAKIQTVAIGDAWEEVEYVSDNDIEFQNVVANGWIEKFYFWLGNQKDIEICKLLYLGCTQQQIADQLGYKNHSGINKRIAFIRDILSAFIDWQNDLELDSCVPPPPELLTKNSPPFQPKDKPEQQAIRYDVIEFIYKRKQF